MYNEKFHYIITFMMDLTILWSLYLFVNKNTCFLFKVILAMAVNWGGGLVLGPVLHGEHCETLSLPGMGTCVS